MALALDHAAITGVQMAEYLGVSDPTVSRWMHDRTPVKRGTLRLWAMRTGVSFYWLETGTAPQLEPGGQMYAIRDSNPEPAGLRHRLTELVAA